MNISARTVTAKMEDELNRIKAGIESGTVPDSRVKEHVTALRTYCDLLLATDSDSSSGSVYAAPASSPSKSREESAMDILERKQMMGDLDDERPSRPAPASGKTSKEIYDSDEHGSSDNLLDF
ncbi:DUF5327 family protein [Alteribacter natronophilus]|uniref:DUF5327 family protein n=1 Tax=Alteribacter natronophilus TaxID=2583810 RepID=UPI00110E1C53|nr:DUF5327 family protein [Alteribacter natronophilus]TMW72107.1 hypothetical protein FGB90_07775 [Alteribacter natronophilus]